MCLVVMVRVRDGKHKREPARMKNTTSATKNTLEGIRKLGEVESWISNLEDKLAENIQSEQ